MLDHDEIVRLYGPWRHRTPADALELFSGYSGLWWPAADRRWLRSALEVAHPDHVWLNKL